MPPLGVFRVVGVMAANYYGAAGASGTPAAPAPYPFVKLYASVIKSHSPLAYYRCNDASGSTLTDYMGSYDATIRGSASILSSTLIVASAGAEYGLHFNGVSANVALPTYGSDTFKTAGAVTFETWLQADTAITSGRAVGLNAQHPAMIMSINQAGASTVRMYVRDVGGVGAGVNAVTDVSQKHHYVFSIIQNGAMHAYLDGVLVDSSTIGTFAYISGEVRENYIGANRHATGSYFPGYMDEVALYTSALSQSHAAKNFFAGKRYHYSRQCMEYGAVRFWPLGEQSGMAAYEYISADDGTYQGSPTYASSLIFEAGGHSFSSAAGSYVSTNYAGIGGAANRSICVWGSFSGASLYEVLYSYGTSAAGRKYEAYSYTGGRLLAAAQSTYKIGSTDITDGARHFLAITYNGSTANASGFNIYVDGVLETGTSVYQANVTVNTDNTATPFRIGRTVGGGSYQDGPLEGMAVFATELTAAQVSTLYQAGITSAVITSTSGAAPWVISYGSLMTRDGSYAYYDFANGSVATGAYTSAVIPSANSLARMNFLGSVVNASGLKTGDTSRQGGRWVSAGDRGYLGPANASAVGLQNEFDGGGTVEWMVQHYGSGGGPGFPRIIQHGSNAAGAGWGIFQTLSGGAANLAFRNSFGGSLYDWYFNNSFGSSGQVIGSTYHCALVYNANATSNTPTLYVNGRRRPTTTSNNPSGTRDSNAAEYIRFGNWQSAFDRTLDGVLDEVSFYASILTGTQIAQHSFAARGWYYSQLCLQYGAQAYYKLGESLSITSTCSDYASTNDGSYQNSPTLGTSLIGEGRSTVFSSASDQYVSTNYAGIGGSNNRTICAWTSAPTISTTNRLICSYGSRATGKHMAFRIDANVGQLGVGWWGAYKRGTTSVDNGKHFVCLTIDGGDANGVHLWVDGTEETYSTTVNGSVVTDNTGDPFMIGRYVGNTNQDFQGKIEGVAVFTTALAANQIAALYSAGLA